jgi:hypothetical protein
VETSQQLFELQGAALRRALHERRSDSEERQMSWISHA